MGAAQRKEAVDYFSAIAVSPNPPSQSEFNGKLARFQQGLCSGSELYGVAQPIVEAMVQRARETGRVRWLIHFCTKSFDSAVGNSSPATDVQLAALRLTELVLRHVLREVKGQSAVLLELLEGTDDLENTQSPSTAAGNGPSVKITGEGAVVNEGRQLCSMLIDYVVKVNLTPATAATHAEVVRLLLTMTSSALHHGTQFDENYIDVFTEMIMSSDILDQFMAVLMQRVVDWAKPTEMSSPLMYCEGAQPSLRNLFNIFGGGGGGGSGPAGKAPEVANANATGKGNANKLVLTSCSTAEMTYRHSAELLAVLVAHQKGNGRNPSLDYVAAITEGKPVSFLALLGAVGAKLTTCPALCMLLYTLLYDHQSFLHEVLSVESEVLLDAIQQVLHLTSLACAESDAQVAQAIAKSTTGVAVLEDPLDVAALGRMVREAQLFCHPFVNFMTSTLLLVLSQDRVVNQLVCGTMCIPDFPLERYTGKLAVSSIMIVVLCHGVTKALNDRNEALAAVFVPCMANIAPFVVQLDPYTAQRLLALLVTLVKKIQRAEDAYNVAVAAPPTLTATGEGEAEGKPTLAAESAAQGRAASKASASAVKPPAFSSDDAAVLQGLCEMYIRQLHALAEAVEGMLRGPTRHNESLIYELLYNRERIVDDVNRDNAGPYVKQAKEILKNLTDMIHSYEAEIASAPSAQSPNEIMDIIRRGSGGAAGSSAAGDGGASAPGKGEEAAVNAAGGAATESGAGGNADLVYTYEESPHSYDFFGPFVWATLLSDARRPGGVLWCRHVNELSLFPQ